MTAQSSTSTADSTSLIGTSLGASLTVKDLQKSLTWYRDIVGFTVDRQHERDGKLMAISLRAGDVRLLIGQDDGAKGWDRAKGEGFSLQVITSQSIDDLAARVTARGGTIELGPIDMPWGARLIRLRDPDGFRINISSQ